MDTLFVSGTRATFTVKEELGRERVARALAEKRVTLESFATEERPRPLHAYLAELRRLG